MEDLDIPSGKIGETAQRVVDRAIDESRRREHGTLLNEHLFLALAQVEWDLFADLLCGTDLNPQTLFQEIDDELRHMPAQVTMQAHVAAQTQIVFKVALEHAARAGRAAISAGDLLAALLEERGGEPATTLKRHGVEPLELAARLDERLRDLNVREEQYKRQFELPPSLRQFSTNLNWLVRQDKLAPVFERDPEIRQILEILCHRGRANSAMLVGEPGVGKTAIVDGLAQWIELEPERVPVRLRSCQIVALNMNAVVAGTQLRGTFEDRIETIIRELKERQNLILFLDEAHTMVGAGAALGAPADAANMFKSGLARGEIRMIAATTLGEYKQHVQEDEALARRFRCVNVPEPTLEESRRIVYNLRPRLERNYSVRILDEALDAALEMSPRYMRHLHLPDKVIGWLDTAAVKAEVDHRVDVGKRDVIAVISQAAQIPEDMVSRDVIDRLHDIESRLRARVVGQTEAVQAVARRLILNKGPLKDGFDRPDGVLLFLGPTGVGKTEVAKAVAACLFGDEKKMIRIDMSEYQEGSATVDKLIGMPRGIVGSDRGGILTNQLRDNPCTVLLLDEVEKASPHLLNLFLQAFDEGWVTDGRGKRAYLSDAIVIMTSNIGSACFRRLTNPLGFLPQSAALEQARADVSNELERRFSPEFRNRIDEVIVFSPLTREEVREIARQHLARLRTALAAGGRTLAVDDQALEAIVDRGHSLEFGARRLKRVIDELIKAPISARLRESSSFRVTVEEAEVVVKGGQLC